MRKLLYRPKPFLEETLFFPSRENEDRLAQILSKAKKTMEICVFAFTNDKLRDGVLHAHRSGCKIRVITDDECSRFAGAEIYNLGKMGIPVTMDNNVRFHMHNKFVVIDSEVLITGSFNWTSQAVNSNQENLLILQNESLCELYQLEFEKLWL